MIQILFNQICDLIDDPCSKPINSGYFPIVWRFVYYYYKKHTISIIRDLRGISNKLYSFSSLDENAKFIYSRPYLKSLRSDNILHQIVMSTQALLFRHRFLEMFINKCFGLMNELVENYPTFPRNQRNKLLNSYAISTAKILIWRDNFNYPYHYNDKDNTISFPWIITNNKHKSPKTVSLSLHLWNKIIEQKHSL